MRFAALGDTGDDSAMEYAVAKALAAKCAQSGCDEVLLLGDDIYPQGPASVTDPAFDNAITKPFAPVDSEFWLTLGNHDYGGGNAGAGTDLWKGPIWVQWAATQTKFILPATTYDRVDGNVHFFCLDSNLMNQGQGAAQIAEWQAKMAAPEAGWKIAFAHHPYLSNGDHGNATGGVLAGYDALVCGHVDLFLDGHDHSMQWLQPTAKCGGTEFVVSGAGAEHTGLSGSNPAYYQSASTFGFFWVEINGNNLHGEFIDQNGNVLFTRDRAR